MRRIVEHLGAVALAAAGRLTLNFHDRRKSRQRALLDSGEEVGLLLPRGTELRAGDRLRCEDGVVIEVAAAIETLSLVETGDRRQALRAAYHLGNRHLPVEITGDGRGVQYQHDHVIDEMVKGLGLSVRLVEAPFQPEGGAYGGFGGHGHDHDHDHDHDHLLAPPRR